MRKIPFSKMSGNGNDFIIIDHRRRLIKEDALKSFIRSVCRPHLSVGADGLILIERSRKADFKWRYFNSDGGEAEFCGNGARCAARYAHLKKIGGRRLSFETRAGIIQADIRQDRVKVNFPSVGDLRLNLKLPLDGQFWAVHFVDTGVPHAVHYVDKVQDADVAGLGPRVRHHSLFDPEGANVNFVSLEDSHSLKIRTYERGVEAETLACGSGAVAAALITGVLGKGQSPMSVFPSSGGVLRVYFRWDGSSFSDVYLEGDAMWIYDGQLWEDAWR